MAVATRIDRIYAPAPFVQAVDIVSVGALSDHKAATCSLSFGTPVAPSYWKLNVSLLQNPLFVARIEDVLQLWRNDLHLFPDPSRHWDSLKSRIRTVSRHFAQFAAHLSRIRVRKAEDAVVVAKAAFAAHPSPETSSRLDLEEERLDEIHKQRLQGSLLRSRSRWLLEGERPSRFFLNLEKARLADTTISTLQTPTGTTVSSPSDLTRTAANFYQQLFRPEDDPDRHALAAILAHLPHLDPEDFTTLDGDLTLAELTAAANRCPSGKCPGPDGLPIEFYQTFWDILGPHLLNVVRWCLHNHAPLPATMRGSAFRLLFKKGDRADLGNWRPIALMPSDAKIVSTVLLHRLERVVPKIIHSDQAGFIRGRSIADHIHSAQATLDFNAAHGFKGAALLLDQAKAYDRVHWAFRDAVLTKIGFPASWMSVLHLLHRDIHGQVIVNNLLSPRFKILRGTRQGDPLSPLLFNLCDEAFACSLRASPLRGLLAPGRPLRLLQYADDKLVGLRDERDIVTLHRVLDLYELASGAKINQAKSELIPLPASAGDNCWTFLGARIIPPGSTTRYLGVQIGINPDPAAVWQPQVDLVRSTLSAWRPRRLTFQGRITVLKFLALSRIWHVAAVIPCPDNIQMALQRLSFEFLWREKFGLVRRDIACAPLHLGGLNMIDVPAQLSAYGVRNLLRLVHFARGNLDDAPLWVSVYVHRLQETPGIHNVFNGSEALLTATPSTRTTRAILGHLPTIARSVLAVQRLRPPPQPPPVPSVKELASRLSAINQDLPDLRDKWQARLGVVQPPRAIIVFRGLWHQSRPHHVRDLLYKIAHSALPTGDRLRHFSDADPNCLACPGSLETPQHLFYSCRIAQTAWADASDIFEAVHNERIVLTRANVLLGTKPSIDRPADDNFWYALHSSFISAIWACRCKARSQNMVNLYSYPAIVCLAVFKLSSLLRIRKLFSADFCQSVLSILDHYPSLF
jgi:hypothetical protein